MKTLLLNLPNYERIQRRYMCSYNAPNMLLPPYELIALAGIVTAWKNDVAILIDAIAENLTLSETITRVKAEQPDIIVALCGFECFEEDMEALAKIKASNPDCIVILFGHYATHFGHEILSNYDFDYIITGEPDLIFSHLYDALKGIYNVETVSGIIYRHEGQIKRQQGAFRIESPQELPMPSYHLLKADKYFEPFMPKPLGLIQTARGCPYPCNYCVRSYGRRLTNRTPQQIIEEIVELKKTLGIRSLRFIDDTFTVNTKRVIEICQGMIDRNLQIEWTCLSRPDSLREEMLPWMQKAGCRRIYFGIESASPKVLDYLNKDLDIDLSLRNLQLCKKYGIETLGFFIVGAPIEDDSDFEMSVNFAAKAKLDYVILSTLIPYPGTPLFEQVKEQLDFSILPYKNEWIDKSLIAVAKKRETEFYRRFYLRTNYFAQSIQRIIARPAEFARHSMKLLSFLLSSAQQRKRENYI